MQSCCHLDKKNKTDFCRKKTMPHYHKYRHLINRPDGLIFILSGEILSPPDYNRVKVLCKSKWGQIPTGPVCSNGH